MSVPMLQHTAVFHEVCAAGSLRRAAERLGVAPSTVSRQLDQLEAHLGARLVDREGRRIRLTEAGEAYRDHTAAIVDAVVRGEDAVREVLAHPAGRLTVAAPVELVRGVVGRVALAYLRAFPDVRLEVLVADHDVLPDGSALHVVLAATRTPPPDHVVRRVVGQVAVRLYASPGYLEAHGDVAHPDELASRRCVVLGAGPAATTVPFVGPPGIVRVQVGAALFTTSVALARRAAVGGVGPTGLPVEAAADDVARGRLVEMLPSWPLADVPLVAYTTSRELPFRARVFLDRLDQELNRR